RVFQIEGGRTVTISGVQITNGLATDRGAAIINAGTLTLNNDSLSLNQVLAVDGGDAMGGAIFNTATGTLTLTGGTELKNSKAAGGGGLPGANGAAASGSGQAGGPGAPGINAGSGLGGGIYNDGGTINITGGSFIANIATGADAGKGGNGGAGW